MTKKLATERRAGRPSLIILSFICLVAGLVCAALFESSLWASIIGLVLLVAAVVVSSYTLYKNRGPFEISIFGLAVVSLGIGATCVFSVGVHDRMESALKTSLVAYWDWVALIVAAVSLIFAACTWVSQEKTQQNTMHITPDIQFELFKDIFRDTYRMLEEVCAIEQKMKERYTTHYPAEYHLLNLQRDEDLIYPDAFIVKPVNYRLLKNLVMSFRKYNNEIKVATKHISSPTMHPGIKQYDFERLKFRIIYTLKCSREVMKAEWHMTNQEIADAVLHHVVEGGQMGYSSERRKLYEEADKAFKSEEDYYYRASDLQYMSFLFPAATDSAEAKDFLRWFNKNVYYMTHSNAICIIPFDCNTSLDN